MSNSINDLINYGFYKVCTKCGIVQLKMHFSKDKSKKEWIIPPVYNLL